MSRIEAGDYTLLTMLLVTLRFFHRIAMCVCDDVRFQATHTKHTEKIKGYVQVLKHWGEQL
jgi:hypothetical protein